MAFTLGWQGGANYHTAHSPGRPGRPAR
jgi:hypothetical protein